MSLANIHTHLLLQKISAISLLAILQVACGGGGGSDTETGVFIDSAVEGLGYESATHSGLTNSKGEFLYEKGERVRFFIGGISLGEARASGQITPIDLVPELTDARHPHVSNMLRFLQSLDADRNLDNGIKIPQIVTSQAAGQTLDFRVDVSGFETEATNLIAFLTSGAITELVDIKSAQAHMFDSLGLLKKVIIQPAVRGSATDGGPQDGTFDTIMPPPNDHLLNNNGFGDFRYVAEFNLTSIPTDAEIVSIRFQSCISAFEGPRQIRLHGYAGEGILSLSDFEIDGLLYGVTLQPIGSQLLDFEVSQLVTDLIEANNIVAGFGLREIHVNGNPNFTVMSVGDACGLTTPPVRLLVQYLG